MPSTGCFCTEYDVIFFKYQKNYLSQNIVIGLILKTVHWTMFSLNAIGLEKKILSEIVQSEKKNILYKATLGYKYRRTLSRFDSRLHAINALAHQK